MNLGYLFSGVVVQLPLLAVIITGLVLVGARRARIGRRSAMLAQIGLGLLVLDVILQAAWTMFLPQVVRSLDVTMHSFGVVASTISMLLTLLLTAALGLLIAAVVTREPTVAAPGPHPYPVDAAPPGSPYAAPPPGHAP